MTLRARDVMQANVLSVSPDMTLEAHEDFLISKRISSVRLPSLRKQAAPGRRCEAATRRVAQAALARQQPW